eukprot:1196032-Prorocentrum_minimum.AAC.8
MVAYRVKLDEVRGWASGPNGCGPPGLTGGALRSGRGPYHGSSTPSSGYLALYLMLQLCDQITVYGFGLDDEAGRAQVAARD